MLARSPRGRRPPSFAVVVACAVLPACAAAAAPTSAPGEKALHAWEGGDSPAALEAWVQDRLRRADADVARVLGAKGARSVPNTLRPYDDAVNELLLAVSQSSVIYGVGATRELRDKAQSLTQTANAAYTALNLNQGVYRALAALPSPADGATRHYLEHSLLEYRLAGVDRDDATRAKIKALQDKITALGLTFERAGGCGAAVFRARARPVDPEDLVRGPALLAGAVPARPIQLRLAERAAVFPLRRGRARGDHDRLEALSPRHPAGERRAHLASVGHHLRRLRRPREARPHLPGHASARGQGQVVLHPAARLRRARPPAPRGRAGVQLHGRHER